MANIKTLLDLRRVKSDGTFNIIFRIIDFKKVYTINSGVSHQQHYWDERKGQVAKKYPNAKLLNIKLSKHFFKIEQVNNEYEFTELNNNCTYSNCNCPDVIDPICVNVGGEIIEFPNACLAECAGYTTADFVACN